MASRSHRRKWTRRTSRPEPAGTLYSPSTAKSSASSCCRSMRIVWIEKATASLSGRRSRHCRSERNRAPPAHRQGADRSPAEAGTRRDRRRRTHSSATRAAPAGSRPEAFAPAGQAPSHRPSQERGSPSSAGPVFRPMSNLPGNRGSRRSTDAPPAPPCVAEYRSLPERAAPTSSAAYPGRAVPPGHPDSACPPLPDRIRRAFSGYQARGRTIPAPAPRRPPATRGPCRVGSVTGAPARPSARGSCRAATANHRAKRGRSPAGCALVAGARAERQGCD